MSPSIDAQGNVFFSLGDTVYAVTGSSGGLIWASTITPVSAWTQPALTNDGQVVVSSGHPAGSGHATVVSLSASNGSPLWTRDIRSIASRDLDDANNTTTGNPYPDGHLSVGPDGLIYFAGAGEEFYAGGPGNAFVALTSTGGVRWSKATTGGDTIHMGALSPGGTTVYMKSGNNYLYAVDTASGGFVWKATHGVGTGNAGRMTVAVGQLTGRIYTYRIDTPQLVAVSPVDGSVVWTATHTFGAQDAIYSPVVDEANGRVYVLLNKANPSRILGYDTATGNTVFDVDVDIESPGGFGLWTAGPLTVAGPDRLYLVAQRNFIWHLYDYNTASNALRWRLQLTDGSGGGVMHAPQIAVSTSAIYVLGSYPSGTDFIRAYSTGTYTAIALSSNTALPTTMFGDTVFLSTVTVAVTGPGGAVPNALTQVNSIVGGVAASSDVRYPPEAMKTNLLGQTTFHIYWNPRNLARSSWATHSGTVTVAGLGLAGTQDIVLHDRRASTFTVSVSTPAIEDDGFGIVRVTTFTYTVSNSTGGRVPNHAVAIDTGSYNMFLGGLCGQLASIDGSTYQLTDSTGQARFTLRLRFAGGGSGYSCIVPSDYQNFMATVTAYAFGLPPLVVDARETRTSTFTVTFSTPVIQSDLRATTMTVTVFDVGGSTVPGTIVTLTDILKHASTGPFVTFFRGYDTGVTGATARTYLIGYTDAFGQARFHITLNAFAGNAEFDAFDDFIASFPVTSLNAPISTHSILVESNFLDHYEVQAPTEVAVGIGFSSTFTALNKWNHRLGLYRNGFQQLTPLIAGTAVQGGGTLGQTLVDFDNDTDGSAVISAQNYNKIESIQIRLSRSSPAPARTGLSNIINVTGPDRFIIEVPTAAVAGQQFVSTITAVDKNGVQVAGYSGTVSLTPVLWNSTTTTGSGQLSVTNANIPSTGRLSFTNQTYSKGEGIRIRAYDSALGVEGVSSSMTVTLPTLSISHYRVSVPTGVTVGIPFRAQFVALDASSNPVTYQLSRSLNVQALLSLSPEISGSGSLGTSASSLSAGTTNTIIANQTYNKIQTVYIKVTDEDGRVGVSTNAVVFSGPTQFDVAIATYAQAGVQFQMIVTARDGGGQQVLGYDGTVSVAAVQAGNTSLSGAGILGVTSLNVASGLGVSPFQTYTKAEGIRLRVTDSAISVTSYSSSMTVRAGPAASMTVGANPQSTVATVPSVLTTTVLDQYSNAVQGATVTYSVVAGSGVLSLSLSGGAVVSAVTTTNSVTNASGQAEAFFGSTNTLSSQANLLRATLGSLLADTTIYNAVLITSAGGAIVNLADPRIRVDCPANAWSFPIRMSAQSRAELSAADLALTTAAFAAQSNVFVSTVVAKLTAVRDSNPTVSAGVSPTKVNLSLPFDVTGTSQVTVGSYRGQSILVPLSVLRVFKLNSATSLFEMVLDGTNLADLSSRTVTAQLADPNGIYAIGAPPFTTLSAGSSGTVTAVLAAGATATVDVPFGAFSADTNLQVGVPSAASVPALPTSRGITGTGLTISIQTTNSLQPIRPVTVNIGYRAQDVLGLNPDHLRLARYDDSTGWVVLDSSVDTIARTVSGETDHFSLFQVVAVAPRADLSSGIVFPNPFRPNAGHTMLKFGQLPALAKVRIFTISGRLLKQLETDATGQVLSWDAKDKDGNILPSGVYLALIESGSDRKTLKFAIQR